MYKKHHSAQGNGTNGVAIPAITQPPAALINIGGIHVTPETRMALHHLAGQQGTTPRRLLRQFVEDGVAHAQRAADQTL